MKKMFLRSSSRKFLSVLLMLFFSGCTGAGDNQGFSSTQDDEPLMQLIRFKQPLSPQEVTAFAQEKNMFPVEVRFQWKNHQGGYRLEGGNLREEMEKFLNVHSEFLEGLLASFQENPSDDALVAGNDATVKEELEVLLSWAGEGYVPIVSIVMSMSSARTAALKQSSVVESVEPAAVRINVSLPATEENDSAEADDISTASYYHESWAPYQGYTKVNKSIAFNRIYFNNKSAYGSTSTYEHETQVYNTNFANYANYWASNLPCAYLDTGYGDDIDNFTIGSACAMYLSLYYGYYTSISLYGQSASTATVRVKGQLGHRSPSSCYSTWCIYPDATTGSMYTFTAPNSGAWWVY